MTDPHPQPCPRDDIDVVVPDERHFTSTYAAYTALMADELPVVLAIGKYQVMCFLVTTQSHQFAAAIYAEVRHVASDAPDDKQC